MKRQDRIDYALYLAGCADTVTILHADEVELLVGSALNGDFDKDIVALQARLPQDEVLRAEFDRYRSLSYLREMQEIVLYKLRLAKQAGKDGEDAR